VHLHPINTKLSPIPTLFVTYYKSRDKKAKRQKTMKFFQHTARNWDTITSTVHSGIMANKGWKEVTEAEFKAIRKSNKKANKASGK